MPHVLHVFTVPDSLVFLSGQLEYLQSVGYRFTIVTSPSSALSEFGARAGINVVGIPMPRRITPISDLRAVAQLTQVVRRAAPDIVHGHTPKGGLLAMLAARTAGIDARVYHMRGLPVETATGVTRPLLTWAERTTCALARTVLCVSPSLRDTAVTAKLVTARKARVLANGSGNGVEAEHHFNPARFDATTRAAVRVQHGIPPDAPVIGFVGRLVRDKGIVELAEAWARIRREYPRAHLLIVGNFEARDAVPRDTREQLAADERVHLTYYREDLPRAYQAMDVLALPSYREGMPNVVLEASAMAIPVVTTRATGCMDAVVDGETGRLIPVGDARALADAVIAYLRDPAVRAAHGSAARARALRDFAPRPIWDALDATYRALL